MLFNGLAVGMLAGSTPLASCSLEFRSVFKARRFRDLLMALQLQALLLAGSHRVSKKGAVGAAFKAIGVCMRALCSISFFWLE